MADTGVAVALLRQELQTARSSPSQECLLATLVARLAPTEPTDWKGRVEAERLFERALRRDYDPLCLLEFSSLKSRQGMRVDAGRLAGRAFALISADSSRHTPELMAELYYRRALPLLAWVRQFDHLIFMADIPVSTPACLESGFFCEAYAHPEQFFERLAERPPLHDLVADERRLAQVLLDSALERSPAHAGALAAALALAAGEGDWPRFRDYGGAAHAADPAAAGPLLTLLTARVQLGDRRAAAAWFDSLQGQMGPDAVARFEGLALVADTALRQRLSGDSAVVYAEAVWGLSDPLYLSETNERRVAHYARVHLAELLFTDPETGKPGRDTPQGRLVIRYGLPAHVFVLKADHSLQLTASQRDMLEEIMACATQPILPYTPGDRPAGEGEFPCAHASALGQPTPGGGRWEFWYFGKGGVPFVFERALGSWTARHMFETASLHLDSLLHQRLPSLYAPPFRDGALTTLVTRFPRPRDPGVEVWGTFGWSIAVPRPAEPVRLGLFLHSRTTGKLVEHAILDRRPGAASQSVRFDRWLPAPPGPLRLAVEGTRFDRDDVAAQERHAVDLIVPAGGDALWLSDLLLGDSARAPEAITARADVRLFGRTDSILTAGAPLALYWEVYGAGDSAGIARYRVRLQVEREGRGVVVSVARFLGGVLGLGRPSEEALEWEVSRPAGDVLPELLVLESVPAAPVLAISVEVTDGVTGRRSVAKRVVTVSGVRE